MHRIGYTWLDIERCVTKHSLTQQSYKFFSVLVAALLINHHRIIYIYIYLFIYFIGFYDAYCKRMRTQSNMKGYVFSGQLLIKTKFL